MRMLNIIAAVIIHLSLIPLAFADVAQVLDQKIVKGEYTITPGFCRPEACKPRTGQFTGSYTATLIADRIFFSNIKIKGVSDNFQLPEDPYVAPPGATASAKYVLQGDDLKVDGYIDSRAFDGPLVEYKIHSRTTGKNLNPVFDPRDFYLARQDYRKCAAPLCGGIFVKKVNKVQTLCPDGRRRAECYVGEVNWGGISFNPFHAGQKASIQLLLRGKLTLGTGATGEKLGNFYGLEAFKPAVDSLADKTFYGVEDNGIRCVTSPCFNLNEHKINSDQISVISDLDLSATHAGEDEIGQAFNLIGEGKTLLVVGKNVRVKQPTGTGIKLKAKNFYLPMEKPAGSS